MAKTMITIYNIKTVLKSHLPKNSRTQNLTCYPSPLDGTPAHLSADALGLPSDILQAIWGSQETDSPIKDLNVATDKVYFLNLYLTSWKC